MRATRGAGYLENFLSRQRARVANSLIPSSHRAGRILDIGCGTSPLFLLSTEFSEKHGIDKVVGAHDSYEVDEQAITIKKYDFETNSGLPYEEDFFDVITMLAVFEHIDTAKLAKILEEIYRILKPCGVYILTTPAAWTDTLLRVLARMNLVSSEEIEEHKDVYTQGKITSLLGDAGFLKEKIQTGSFELFMNLWATATK